MRLAIVTTHPIQYNAPWFKLLAETTGVEVMVFYTWEQSQTNAKYDPGFGRVVSWDIPLQEGYDHVFVKNVAVDPGSHHYKGIDNPTLNDEIKAWKPDFLLVIGWPFKSHLACLKYFKGKVPILFRGDSTLLDETAGIKKILRRMFLRYVYSHVDYAFYVGTNNKAYFTAHGIKEQQLWYVLHAIDNDRFSRNAVEDKEAALKWRQELGISDKDLIVLYAGKLEPVKNPGYILELAAQMQDADVRFVIVGNGPLEQELKEKAAHDKRIIFIDFQNQQKMPVVYQLGDVIILPSKSETWGLALNEAMACGKPVIASDKVGAAVDLVKDNGIIINTADTTLAKNYIHGLIANRKQLQEQGKRSLELIKDFTFGAIAASIVKLMERYSHK